ncbi:iron ABC transporter permease [Xanthocytophaga agilis]|uniref:Iron ABC transporter permease n=1 Tax=Xanthocytophaga agilis TaxID=3048010 RepID=A0AAE3R5P8_9BACT|nr:iron ABC transporter permease [Xanthocytophaga agilis]MDJ1503705.1 iron ABC transporter permease [Xanthocytophaga agilis]
MSITAEKPATNLIQIRKPFQQSVILTLLVVGLVVSACISACVGAVKISLSELYYIFLNQLGIANQHFEEQQQLILTVIRLPRVLLGVMIGAVLGITGAAMQGLFRNPLADPGLIGISSGASLFAVSAIVLELKILSDLSGWVGLYALSAFAFVGACLATILVYQISRSGGKIHISTMLLAGIAVNALTGALTGLLIYLANDAQLRTITFWSLGSLGGANWPVVWVLLPFVCITLFGLPRLGKALNAFSLGESQAEHLGINAASLKRQVILFCTLGVGVSVAMAGLIGFVGLVVPHMIRLLVGANHRLVLPGSALLGAIVLTLADLTARTIVAPAELSIGILTALLGAPVFLYILLKEHKR